MSDVENPDAWKKFLNACREVGVPTNDDFKTAIAACLDDRIRPYLKKVIAEAEFDQKIKKIVD